MRRLSKTYELKRISWRSIFLKVGKLGVKWDITIMVNNTIMEQHTDNPDSVFLNPEYLESLNQESLNQVPEITDDEFREFILTHNYEMPDELQKYVEEYMNNPLNKSDSRILGWIKDWIEHPEKSKIYRDKILFKNPS